MGYIYSYIDSNLTYYSCTYSFLTHLPHCHPHLKQTMQHMAVGDEEKPIDVDVCLELSFKVRGM